MLIAFGHNRNFAFLSHNDSKAIAVIRPLLD